MPSSRPLDLSFVFTTSTQVPLYWTSHGPTGGERAIVLHGGPGAHHDYLLPQMLALAANRELIFYDQRGGGQSRTDDPAPITWETQVRDLGAVVAELELRPLTIIGYSWGGLLALLYAIEAAGDGSLTPPSRLVLIEPAPLNRTWRQQFEAEFQARQTSLQVRKLRDELAASGLRESDHDAWRQRQFELGVAGYFADPARATQLTPFRVTGKVQSSIWESLGDYDLIPRISGLETPALFVHGWRDPIPVDSTLAAARAMSARCVVLEGSGHVPYVEQPDALFSAIEQFLEDTSDLVR